MRLSIGKDRAHPSAGINDACWSSLLDGLNGVHRASIFCHPMVSTTQFIVNNAGGAYFGQKPLNEKIGHHGWSHGASDLGYFNTGGWGNPAEQTRVGELASWARGGMGGSPSKPLVAVGISAGMMGLFNYFGQAGDPADVAAFVIILPPYDLVDIYTNNLGGGQAAAAAAWGISIGASLPAFASPKENAPALAGTVGRIYFASDDPLNGATVVNDMLATLGSGWSSINLGALGHTENAIAAVDIPELLSWLFLVAPPV